MIETRAFSKLAVLGAASGILLEPGGFGALHEVAEWVMGHPIWTHEFASKELGEELARRISAQVSDLPSREVISQLFTETDTATAVAHIQATYAGTVTLVKGSAERTAGPIETLNEMLR